MKKDFYSVFIEEIILTIIAPKKIFLKTIVDALNLIKNTDVDEYNNLLDRLDIIFVTRTKGSDNIFIMPEKIWFGSQHLFSQNNIKWNSSIIVHEGFHSTQYKNGKYILPFGEQIEKPAIEYQVRFLEKLGYKEGIEHAKKSFQNKYWIEMQERAIATTSYIHFDNLLNCLKKGVLNLTKINLETNPKKR